MAMAVSCQYNDTATAKVVIHKHAIGNAKSFKLSALDAGCRK